MVAQTHRVRHVSFRAYTTFVGPYSLFWTEKSRTRNYLQTITYKQENKHTEKNRAGFYRSTAGKDHSLWEADQSFFSWIYQGDLTGQSNKSHFSWASGQRRVRRGSLWIQLKHTPFWNDLWFLNSGLAPFLLFFPQRTVAQDTTNWNSNTCNTSCFWFERGKYTFFKSLVISYDLKAWGNNMQRFETQDKIPLALHLNE